MRIALAHSHANTFGGGERALLGLATSLASRGHAIQLLLGKFDPARTFAGIRDFPIRRIDGLEWLAAEVPADAIIANSFGANLLALRNGRRVGYWVHSTRSVFLTSGSWRRLDLQARRGLDRLAVRRGGALIANSHFTASQLRRLYGRDADAVVYPAVDLELFTPSDATSGTYAITVGRLAPEKGLHRLLRLWRDLPDVPLVVVGSGAPGVVRELRRIAPSGVSFRGALPPEAVAEAYRHASLAVFAAHGEELGIAPLEAMASGRPVVATREGGLVETVVDGECGYLADDEVTFRQRVRLLAHDAPLRQQLGLAARRRAEQFNWTRAAEAMEAICERLARPAQ